MKKTWTTRILIALLTLALVVGVFGVAPKKALAAVTAIEFDPTPANKELNKDNQSIELYVKITSDPIADPEPDVTWTSSNDNIVDFREINNKMIEVFPGPAGHGIATITASAGEQSDTIDITVTPSFSFSLDKSSIAVGEYATYTAIPWPMADSITVTSSDPAVSIDMANNRVKGVSKITNATITGTMRLGGTPYPTEATLAVTAITPVITPGSTTVTVERGKTVSLSATSTDTADDITWAVTGGDGNGTLSTATTKSGGTVTYTAPTDSNITSATVTLNQTGAGNYTSAEAKTITINLTAADPGLWARAASSTATFGGNKVALNAGVTNTTGGTFQWSIVKGAAAGDLSPADGAGASIAFVPKTGVTGTIPVEIQVAYDAPAGYEDKTAKVNISVSEQFVVDESSLATKVGATTYESFTIVTTPGSSNVPRVVSNKTSIAAVEPKTSATNNGVYTYQVRPVSAGDTTISVYDAANTLRGTIPVHVASSVPIIETSFVRDGNPIPHNLNQVWSWGQLVVRVKDYNTAYPYVTLTRSNIRTYIQGGAYYSHPSTYSYTAYLTADPKNANDGVATLSVIAQYNGSTYYTAAYTGATSVNSPTIYVSGFTTLPQTGPNYIWAYVLGGLCLASVATAVTLNVRKKKRESI